MEAEKLSRCQSKKCFSCKLNLCQERVFFEKAEIVPKKKSFRGSRVCAKEEVFFVDAESVPKKECFAWKPSLCQRRSLLRGT